MAVKPDSFSWGLCPLLPRGKKGIQLSRLPNPFPHCPAL